MRHSSMQRPLMTSTAGWGRASTPQQGIVMVMTLILLTVMAVSTAVAVRLSLTTDMVGANLRARTLAQWSAENRLTEIRVRHEFPAVGRRNFDCPQGDLTLLCQEDVYTTANPNFRRIEIQVFDPAQSGQTVGGSREGGRLARLLGFAVVDNNTAR